MPTWTEHEDEGTTETEQEAKGFGERVTGGVKRAAGAIGRAARSAMGQPEAGTDLLYQCLHAEHEEVSILVQKLLASDEEGRQRMLWKAISVNLTAHARAEQEVVYSRLEHEQDLAEKVGHAYDEHADIERLLAECDAVGLGTDEFFAMVTELDRVVRHHVDEEEGDILSRAAREIPEEERDALVFQFRERKMEIMPGILQELGFAKRGQSRSASSDARSRQGADRRRSAQRSSGSRSSDDLSHKSIAELREMATASDIRGRSKMDRKQLVAALSRR